MNLIDMAVIALTALILVIFIKTFFKRKKGGGCCGCNGCCDGCDKKERGCENEK